MDGRIKEEEGGCKGGEDEMNQRVFGFTVSNLLLVSQSKTSPR